MEKKSKLLRLIIEEREDVITWNDQIPNDCVMECLIYIKDILRKKYSTDTFQFRVPLTSNFKKKDYENQHYDLEGILKFEVTPIFITIQHRKDVKTFTKVDPRAVKNLYAFKDSSNVKITKFENSKRIEETEMKVSAFQVLNNKNKDNQYEDPLLNETSAVNDLSKKLENVQIHNPTENPKITNPYQFVQVKKEDSKEESPDFKKKEQTTSSTTKPEVKQDTKVNSVNTSTASNTSSTNKTTTSNTSSSSTGQGKSQSDFVNINSQNKNPLGKKVELQNYTLADVAKHNTIDDCWMVINGKVYDVTKYIPYHPGGKKIMEGAGKDGTSLFSKKRILR